MDQIEIVRDLNRIVNNPKLEQRARNIAIAAIKFIREQEDKIAALEDQVRDQAPRESKIKRSCDTCRNCVINNSVADQSHFVHCSKRGLRLVTLNIWDHDSEFKVKQAIQEKTLETATECNEYYPIR